MNRITREMMEKRLEAAAAVLGKAHADEGRLAYACYSPSGYALYALIVKDPDTGGEHRLSEFMPRREFWRYLTGLADACDWLTHKA